MNGLVVRDWLRQHIKRKRNLHSWFGLTESCAQHSRYRDVFPLPLSSPSLSLSLSFCSSHIHTQCSREHGSSSPSQPQQPHQVFIQKTHSTWQGAQTTHTRSEGEREREGQGEGEGKEREGGRKKNCEQGTEHTKRNTYPHVDHCTREQHKHTTDHEILLRESLWGFLCIFSLSVYN